MFKALKKAFGAKSAGEERTPEESPEESGTKAAAEAAQPPAQPRVKDKYPEVEKIALNTSIKAPFEKIEPTVRGFNMGPDSLANFQFRCKNTECVNGGFDLTDEIERMIRDYETSGHGRRVCQGWDGKKNIDHQRCYYEFNFVINISYR